MPPVMSSSSIKMPMDSRGASGLTVQANMKIPVDLAERFQVFRQKEIELAEGDVVRITHNGRTADEKHRLENGSVYKVAGFDTGGNIVLDNGWTVGREYGHLPTATWPPPTPAREKRSSGCLSRKGA